MKMERLRKLFAKKTSAARQSIFEEMKEALKPTKVRGSPPKPFNPPPKISKRSG